MKKALYLASACLLAIAFSSCEKELENPRKGANDFNTFYTNATADDADKLIAQAYNTYFGGPEEVQKQNFFEIISDDMDCGGGTYSDNANRYRNDPDARPSYKCNIYNKMELDLTHPKEFIDAIRCRNGNLNISCGREEDRELM